MKSFERYGKFGKQGIQTSDLMGSSIDDSNADSGNDYRYDYNVHDDGDDIDNSDEGDDKDYGDYVDYESKVESAQQIHSGSNTINERVVSGRIEPLQCETSSSDLTVKNKNCLLKPSFQWALRSWNSTQNHQRKNSNTVRVDLASPEDISLHTDSSSYAVLNTHIS